MTTQHTITSRFARTSMLATTLSLATLGITFSSTSSANEPQATTQSPASLENTILQRDAMFWKAYNECDLDQLPVHVAQDVEFYHDKGGLMEGLDALVTVLKRSMCKPDGKRLRREAIAETIKVYPMNNYGAIISGEHKFYVTEPGTKENIDSIARFTHLWHLSDGHWQMTRVLSYDHVLVKQEPSK